uniref:C2H2-type domain-containing protein n=1 Tax=Onchocerca volvulus TaxID=6282 RepID=A0A8R1Y4E7_ONCVO
MHKNRPLRQCNNYYIVGWLVTFFGESCSRISILFPYYFSFVLLQSYIAQVTAPNVGNTSLQAEIIDHLKHENFIRQLKSAAIDQHLKSASSSRTDKQFEEKRANGKCFKCNLCDKQFDFLYRLQQHNLSHANNKSFTCKLCDKAFKYFVGLKRHEKKHGEERPFLCDQCGKIFKQRSILKTHECIHKDKAFKCDECGKRFDRNDHLKLHKKTHRKSSKRPFSRASTLTTPTAKNISATAALIEGLFKICGFQK